MAGLPPEIAAAMKDAPVKEKAYSRTSGKSASIKVTCPECGARFDAKVPSGK